MTGLVAALLLVGAVVVIGRRGGARRRLHRIDGPARPARPARARRDRVRWAALAGGLAVALVVGGWIGVAVGMLAAVALDRGLRRLEPRHAREARLAAGAELPFAIDLLAAGMRAGSPPAVAARCVGDALGGPLGARLCRVAYGLGLGGAPQDAWSHLDGVPGADRLRRAVVRSSESGAALVGSLTRLSDDLRAARATACEAAARRSGVLVVLPLGLCFLPAFVLAGLVPVVLAVLGEVMP